MFKKAERLRQGHFVCLYRPNELGFSRIGLMIAKKQLKRAVWRNRVKRLIRETFRVHKESIHGIDIIFFGYKGLETQDNKTVTLALEELWKKLGKASSPF